MSSTPASPHPRRAPSAPRSASSRALRRHGALRNEAIRIDALEPRRLLADQPWGADPRLIRQDRAAAAYPGITGEGQVVVVIDTGIDYTHPAFGGKPNIGDAGSSVIAGYDFYDDDADPIDTDGHGTQVAGMIASARFESGGFVYQGIAPDAKLIALRVAPSTGNVSLPTIEEALQWVVANAEQYSIDVVNVSFGYGRFADNFSNDILSNEIATLTGRGIFVTASSGNEGTADGFGITYPAADPGVVSVGGVDGSDVIGDYSQRSANLKFLAPGTNVRSPSAGGGFSESTGTSFAAPTVAGLIALVREVDPNFTYGDVYSILRSSSRLNLDGDAETGDVTNQKFARIDVYGAVALAEQRKAGTSQQQAAIGFAGNNNAVAVDPHGVTHLAYFDSADETMKYATRQKSGQWSPARVVDASNLFQGQYISMKLDRWGRPNLAYFDGTAGDLKYAQLNSETVGANAPGVAWKIEVVDGLGSVGLYPSIVVATDDVPHITYYRRSSGDLRLASRYPSPDGNGGTQNWRILDVDIADDVGRSGTLALDRNGKLVVAYESSTLGKVRVARQNNALSSAAFPDWTRRTVTTADPGLETIGAGWISLAIDTANRAHLSYYNIGPADLNYAKLNDNGTFTVQAVATKKATGQYSQIYLENDRPRLLFQNRAANGMNRALTTNGVWEQTSLVPLAGRFITVASDASRAGKFVYTYYLNSAAGLVLAST